MVVFKKSEVVEVENIETSETENDELKPILLYIKKYLEEEEPSNLNTGRLV